MENDERKLNADDTDDTDDNAIMKEVLGERFDRGKLQAMINLFKQVDAREKQASRTRKAQQHGAVKTYTTVIKKYHCIVCNMAFSLRFEAGKGETVTSFDAEGRVHIIGVSGKQGEVEIPCELSKCPYCPTRIKSWDRDRLERAFIFLLEQVPVKERANFAHVCREDADGRL